MFKKLSTGTEWESVVGYSRAVKAGNTIHVAGTTATNSNGDIVGINDPYEQTIQILNNIENSLKYFGANLENVYRTRIYAVNIEHWQEIGKAHGKFFGDIRPASAMVQVARLITPEMLVEIEAEAYLE